MEERELIAYDRMSQIYELSIKMPIKDKGSKVFYNSLIENVQVIPIVGEDSVVLENIHSNDVINVLVNCFDYCHEKKYDTTVLTSVLSIFNTFKNLRCLSFAFLKDSDILENYMALGDSDFKGNKGEMFNGVYDIKKMEIHLSDSLDRNVVDFLNNMFMFYGYIPNDYMNRRFYIDFEFDEYIAFIQMVFSNNKELVKQIGMNVVNFLILFPVIVIERKPKIRIVTNYFDL